MRFGRCLAACILRIFSAPEAPLWFNKVETNGTEFRRCSDRCRPGRLHGRDPRRAARLQDCLHRRLVQREGQTQPGRDLPERGLHPVQGLLESSENYERVAHKFAEHGITVEGAKVDVAAMLARKDKIVDTFTGGIALLFKKNKVASMYGHGSFIAGGDVYRIQVKDGNHADEIVAQHVIIATGSVARALPDVPFDNEHVLDNAGALSLSQIPKRLGVVGAGVIGLEMGSVWRRLGSDVTILEALPAFLPAADEQVAKEAFRVFNGPLDLKIYTGVKITSVKTTKSKGVSVTYTDRDGNTRMAEFDKLIVAIGRVPNTAGLNGEAVGLALDARGYVEVDDSNHTNLPNVYAIGDVVRGPDACAQVLGGGRGGGRDHRRRSEPRQPRHHPLGDLHLAGDRLGRQDRAAAQSRQHTLSHRAVSFHRQRTGARAGRNRRVREDAGARRDRSHPRSAHHRSLCLGADCRSGGGDGVRRQREDIARIVHAHPTLSEAMHEAALGVHKRSLNI